MKQVGIHRDGAFAEYVALPARQVIPASEDALPEVLALTVSVACECEQRGKRGHVSDNP